MNNTPLNVVRDTLERAKNDINNALDIVRNSEKRSRMDFRNLNLFIGCASGQLEISKTVLKDNM